MNKFIISGRLAADPEYRQTATGTDVVQFNFAVNRRYKKEGEPDADFFRITAFSKVAETFSKCQISKGTKLLLECEVRNNNYADKNGVKHYDFQFIVSSFEFCESKTSQQKSEQQDYAPAGRGYGTPTQQPSYQQQGIDPAGFMPVDDEISEEDLPF